MTVNCTGHIMNHSRELMLKFHSIFADLFYDYHKCVKNQSLIAITLCYF